MSKISVIVPCYNVEHYLSECLDSIENQSFKDFEIVCIEDCSTDNTKNILENYAGKYKNIHIVYNKENKGLAVSRNVGMENANGDFIYFLDSDDSVAENCLEKLYKKILKDKSDLVIGSVSVYPENKDNEFCVNKSNFLQDWVNFEPFQNLQITENNSDEYYNKLYCCAWNKLYKKDFLLKNDIFFINKKCFHEDNGFWLKVLACNPMISCISEKTYLYRIRDASITAMTDSDKNLHISHLKFSLEDALFFVKQKNNKKLANFIYYEIYKLRKHRLLYFIWTKFEKRIRILFLPIFSLNERKLKIFGIPVYIWRKK